MIALMRRTHISPLLLFLHGPSSQVLHCRTSRVTERESHSGWAFRKSLNLYFDLNHIFGQSALLRMLP